MVVKQGVFGGPVSRQISLHHMIQNAPIVKVEETWIIQNDWVNNNVALMGVIVWFIAWCVPTMIHCPTRQRNEPGSIWRLSRYSLARHVCRTR